MKKMKKLSMFFAAILMMIVMVGTAFAEGTKGSITINNTEAEKEYDLYRIFDLTYDETTKAVAYTINDDWAGFFTGNGAKYIIDKQNSNYSNKLSPIVVTENNRETVKYLYITDSNVAGFSTDALSYVLDGEATAIVTKKADSDSITVENLELGYYLVYPKDAGDIKEGYACLSSLTSLAPNGNVVVKATYPTITKDVDDVSVELGQVVTYTITGKVPNTTGKATYTYKITDHMTNGLTFNGLDTIIVKIGTTDITNKVVRTDDNNGFILEIPVNDYQDQVGATITVTYTATVNENAISKIEENKAYLEYGHDKDELKKSTEIKKEVYTAKIVIDKYDATSSNAKLANAEFILKNVSESSNKDKYYKLENNKVTWVASASDATVKITDKNGAAKFEGLEDGTYHLIEVKAPAGYNKLPDPVEVVINGKKDSEIVESLLTVTVNVPNNSGLLLPSTGGMGTTILYVAGGILVLAAAVMMVLMNRKKAEN